VGGIDSAMGNQIVRHSFVELSLFNMSLFNNTVDLGQRKAILFL